MCWHPLQLYCSCEPRATGIDIAVMYVDSTTQLGEHGLAFSPQWTSKKEFLEEKKNTTSKFREFPGIPGIPVAVNLHGLLPL